MASEILRINEEDLTQFVVVLRAGLAATPGTDQRIADGLIEWCDDIDDYLTSLASDDASDDDTDDD